MPLIRSTGETYQTSTMRSLDFGCKAKGDSLSHAWATLIAVLQDVGLERLATDIEKVIHHSACDNCTDM